MSQAINTLWVNRVGASAKVNLATRRRLRVRRLLDGLVMMIFIAAAAICVSLYWRGRVELGSAIMKHKAATSKVDDLKLQSERLKREVDRLRTDAKSIESLARQNLGLIREGELVITVSPDRKELPTDAAVTPVGSLTPKASERYTETAH